MGQWSSPHFHTCHGRWMARDCEHAAVTHKKWTGSSSSKRQRVPRTWGRRMPNWGHISINLSESRHWKADVESGRQWQTTVSQEAMPPGRDSAMALWPFPLSKKTTDFSHPSSLSPTLEPRRERRIGAKMMCKVPIMPQSLEPGV